MSMNSINSININMKLHDNWTLWNHKSKNDWTIKGYDKLCTIETIKDFWSLTNSWEKNGGIHMNQYFLMKNNIHPIWEHDDNRNGGCRQKNI